MFSAVCSPSIISAPCTATMRGVSPELSVMCSLAPALSRHDTMSVLIFVLADITIKCFLSHLSVDDCKMQQCLTQLILREKTIKHDDNCDVWQRLAWTLRSMPRAWRWRSPSPAISLRRSHNINHIRFRSLTLSILTPAHLKML